MLAGCLGDTIGAGLTGYVGGPRGDKLAACGALALSTRSQPRVLFVPGLLTGWGGFGLSASAYVRPQLRLLARHAHHRFFHYVIRRGLQLPHPGTVPVSHVVRNCCAWLFRK